MGCDITSKRCENDFSITTLNNQLNLKLKFRINLDNNYVAFGLKCPYQDTYNIYIVYKLNGNIFIEQARMYPNNLNNFLGSNRLNINGKVEYSKINNENYINVDIKRNLNSLIFPTNCCVDVKWFRGYTFQNQLRQIYVNGTSSSAMCINECRSNTNVFYDDPCLSSPCRNGGNCYIFGTNLHRCQCPYPYAGNNCEFKEVWEGKEKWMMQQTAYKGARDGEWNIS
ncbi:hypothetical protein SNEBB_006963 [Seison nebaliae]|nr:hypothetical protein SNEBB_006963 [Seison nebaliae]